jgi:hypothetical protein
MQIKMAASAFDGVDCSAFSDLLTNVFEHEDDGEIEIDLNNLNLEVVVITCEQPNCLQQFEYIEDYCIHAQTHSGGIEQHLVYFV